MKKFLYLSIFLGSIVHSMDAQWYQNNCGIIDLNDCTIEEFECLWEKTSRITIAGTIVTGIGTTCVLGGVILGLEGFQSIEDQDNPFRSVLLLVYSGTLIYAGSIIDLVGIPILVVGIHRKSQLRKHPNYESRSLGTMHLKPIIGRNQINNSYYVGLTTSLSF